jgi:RHS repeat-associated protein
MYEFPADRNSSEVVGGSCTIGYDWNDRFTGKPYSAATGLYYDYQRWYDPSIGRFISQDPLFKSAADPRSLNPYIYVRNTPTVLRDPTGWTETEEGNYGGENLVALGDFLASLEDSGAIEERGSLREPISTNDSFDITEPGASDTIIVDRDATISEPTIAVERNYEPASTASELRVPNPNGKLGSPEHQAGIEAQANDIRLRNPELNIVREYRTKGPFEKFGSRYADLVALDKQGNLVEVYQVGRVTGEGFPVSREVNAISDIDSVVLPRYGIFVRYIPYYPEE